MLAGGAGPEGAAGATLTNSGLISGDGSVAGAMAIINAASGTIDATGGNLVLNASGGTLANSGLIEEHTGAGELIFKDATLSGAGTLADSGKMQLADVTITGGHVSIAAGA